MISLNCRDIILKVRQRTHDMDERTFDDAEILGALDDALRQLFPRIRGNGDPHTLDRMDVALAQMTAVSQDIYEYAMPEYVGDVQLVEGIITGQTGTLPMPQLSLEDKDVYIGNWGGAAAGWHFSRWSNAGSIRVVGKMGTMSGIRIWYAHVIGPMCYGTTASGSTTSIVAGTVTGAYKKRAGIYVGHELEILVDSTQPTNVGAVRRITAFASNAFTIDALPAVANTTTQWAMMVPLPGENMEYLTALTVYKLMQRRGADEELMLLQNELGVLDSAFQESTQRRSTGEPPRFTSSRRFH